jgi:hypothetical protein
MGREVNQTLGKGKCRVGYEGNSSREIASGIGRNECRVHSEVAEGRNSIRH